MRHKEYYVFILKIIVKLILTIMQKSILSCLRTKETKLKRLSYYHALDASHNNSIDVPTRKHRNPAVPAVYVIYSVTI